MKLRIVEYPWAEKPFAVEQFNAPALVGLLDPELNWIIVDAFGSESEARQNTQLRLQGSRVIAEFTSDAEVPSEAPGATT